MTTKATQLDNDVIAIIYCDDKEYRILFKKGAKYSKLIHIPKNAITRKESSDVGFLYELYTSTVSGVL